MSACQDQLIELVAEGLITWLAPELCPWWLHLDPPPAPEPPVRCELPEAA